MWPERPALPTAPVYEQRVVQIDFLLRSNDVKQALSAAQAAVAAGAALFSARVGVVNWLVASTSRHPISVRMIDSP